MIELLKFMSDVLFELLFRSSPFFFYFATVSADITVCFYVFFDLSGFSFFIKFQACQLDRVKFVFSILSLHFFVCFLEGMQEFVCTLLFWVCLYSLSGSSERFV